jgi:ribonucleoside-diphosphate reductase alpha chain
MKFRKYFTNGRSPFECVDWAKEDIEQKNIATNEVIFKIEQAEVPTNFSKNAREILVSKYFRMTEVPIELVPVDEVNKDGKSVPSWLRRNKPTKAVENIRAELKVLKDEEEYLRLQCDKKEVANELKEVRKKITDIRVSSDKYFTHENSAKQVFHRLAGFWAYWGWMRGYFDAENDAKIFYDETIYMLANQLAAPNTPQWFNSGLYWAYGIEGDQKGFWRYNPDTKEVEMTTNFYQYPGIHACHILGTSDSLFDEGGIYDNLTIEAKAFAIGGGAGKNTSNIRSKYEYLRTGSKASGSMEFAMIDDKSAGVIKSGSGQRRAAKMVIKDMDDPEVPEFIMWKANEEKKVAALAAGGYNAGWEGEAYKTVSGQNSNNSVRISDDFMVSMMDEEIDWPMTSRTTGEVVRIINTKELWKLIVKSCWESGDPGIQFDSTIQSWDTCPKDGRIRATNPCSEYIFKDNTSCNLASINLQNLLSEDGKSFLIDDFNYICAHWLTILDISIEAAQLPSQQLAEGTALYRTTGLGHTGIGAMFEKLGISYDSDAACHMAAAISSLMTAQCYIMSSKLASRLGTFEKFKNNKKDMLRVLNNHRLASMGGLKDEPYDGVIIKPWEIDHALIPKDLSKAVMSSWDEVMSAGKRIGFRNAFVTLIQPSGTVGLLMDCDTMAIEPDYAAVKSKKLSGGGSMKMVNQSIRQALFSLGYNENQVDDVVLYMTGNDTLDGAPHINRVSLLEAGITVDDIDTIESKLESAIQLRDAFDKLSDESIRNIGLIPGRDDEDINIFKQMNFTKEQYIEATKWICGNGTIEGAPHIKRDHLPIFDCALRSGFGSRYLRWQAHVRMMSAVSPFISGGISKTLNMPAEATTKDMESAMLMVYDGRGSAEYCPGGVKCIAIYRDGSKRSQPLTNAYDIGWWDPVAEDKLYLRGMRKRPPKKRNMIAHEVTVRSQANTENKFIIKFGEYEDGSLAEIWIEVTKDNPSFYLAMKWASRAISNAIQYGMPLEDILKSFANEEGGPGGLTDHKYITVCKSIIDFAVKLAMLEYEGDITFCRRKPPMHEIRCGQIKNKRVGDEIKLEEKTINLRKIGGDNMCSKCGSTNIQRYPCEVCLRCGASLGGCSP